MITDILFTPVVHPPIPQYDKEDLRAWLDEVYPQTILRAAKAPVGPMDSLQGSYPWNLTYAKFVDLGWQNQFNERFPELTEFLPRCFGLEEDDVGMVILLPLRDTHTGLGFLHLDTDHTGMRIYLEIEHRQENPLVIIPTKRPHTEGQPKVGNVVMPDNPLLQDVALEATLPEGVNAYYLNNFRCVHAPLITRPGQRLAVVMYANRGRTSIVSSKIRVRIEESARVFKEAIYWHSSYLARRGLNEYLRFKGQPTYPS